MIIVKIDWWFGGSFSCMPSKWWPAQFPNSLYVPIRTKYVLLDLRHEKNSRGFNPISVVLSRVIWKKLMQVTDCTSSHPFCYFILPYVVQSCLKLVSLSILTFYFRIYHLLCLFDDTVFHFQYIDGILLEDKGNNVQILFIDLWLAHFSSICLLYCASARLLLKKYQECDFVQGNMIVWEMLFCFFQ